MLNEASRLSSEQSEDDRLSSGSFHLQEIEAKQRRLAHLFTEDDLPQGLLDATELSKQRATLEAKALSARRFKVAGS